MKILNIVDKHLELSDRMKCDGFRFDKETQSWKPKPRDSHHPSGYNKCLRQMYYEWTGEKVTNYRTATDCYRMLVGTWCHRGFAYVLKEIFGDKVKDEVEFFHIDPRLKYPIHGFMDNIIELDGEKAGVELKTVFGRGATAIKDSGKPRDDDDAQRNIYLAIPSLNMDSFTIPYLARDSFYRCEFDKTMTLMEKHEFLEKVIAKFKKLEDAVENKELPDRDFHAVVKDGEIRDSIQYKNKIYKSNWQCTYCIYRDGCYAKEINEFDIYIPEKLMEG